MGTPDITVNGDYTPEAIAFYENLAKGGVAAVCCTEGIVHPTGKSHARMIDMQSDFVIASLTKAARAIRRHGAVANLELSHGGKYTEVDNLNAAKISAAGDVRYGPVDEILPNGTKVTQMPVSLIKEIADGFAEASALAKRAGFEMILIHAGHGWLLHQFLSSVDNRRGDGYGGGIFNRSRFLLEVLEATRAAVGPLFPIEVRLSAEDYRQGGDTIEDTIETAKLIDGKADLIHITTGTRGESYDRTHPSSFYPRGCNVHYAAAVKRRVKTPVATVGSINEPEMIEDIISSGKADVVQMARAILADPYLPRKLIAGDDRSIMRCILCYNCTAGRTETKTRRCSVNPVIGNETLTVVPAAQKKRVAVAGGGPGGMTAALTAARRGHSVILFEKEPELGGALRCERKMSFKQDFFNNISVMEHELETAGVTVKKSAAFTRETALEIKPDVLIVAVGAKPVLPALPGTDNKNVILAAALSDDGVEIGDRVAVLGGGLVGCEAAIHLAMSGKKVTIAEMLPKIARDANIKYGPVINKKISELGIEVLVNVKASSADETGLTVSGPDGERHIPADTILIAAGQKPDRETANSLRDCAPIVLNVGDCASAGTLADAMAAGYWTASDI